MNTKYCDISIAILLLIDLGIIVFLVLKTISVWGGINQMYIGFSLVHFIIRIIFHLFLAVASIALFFKGSNFIKIAFPAYALLYLVIEKVWVITPNGPAYLKMLEEMHEHKLPPLPTESIVVEKVFMYPNIFVYLLFVLVLLYIFIVRDKLTKREQTIRGGI